MSLEFPNPSEKQEKSAWREHVRRGRKKDLLTAAALMSFFCFSSIEAYAAINGYPFCMAAEIPAMLGVIWYVNALEKRYIKDWKEKWIEPYRMYHHREDVRQVVIDGEYHVRSNNKIDDELPTE